MGVMTQNLTYQMIINIITALLIFLPIPYDVGQYFFSYQ
ncbi:Uncharacterised protein [Shewanella baltica]|nr:Uncharacterised protein [Shewanella baltica]